MTDPDLVDVATAFRAGILDGGSSYGMCAAVCWPLASMLSALYDVRCETVQTVEIAHDCDFSSHVWILLEDGRALDPTADQFPALGLPPVYLGPPLATIHSRKDAT